MLRAFILETATNPGASVSITLNGAQVGRRAFASVFGIGAALFYVMDSGTLQEWGIGQLTAANTLQRTTVRGNSSGTTARIAFTGSVNVYCDLLPENAIYADSLGNVTLNSGVLYGLAAGTGSDHAVNLGQMNAALAAYQPALGYTPVQQGTGVGQGSNAVKLGWSGSRLKATVDSTDLGNLVTDGNLANSALVTSTATGQSLMTAADAAAARGAIAADVTPNTTAGAVGEFRLINPGSGNSAVLPAGGSWQYFVQTFAVATGAYLFVQTAGVAAGGTTVVAGSAGNAFIGWCKRIA